MQAVELERKQPPEMSPEETVLRIQQGSEELRNPFITQYQPYIAAITARLTGKPAQDADEYGVALDAFNEAIDRYDPKHRRGFLSWSDLVINHRIIDHLRRVRKHSHTYPFTYFEAQGDEHVVARAVAQHPTMLQDNLEIKEEIEDFSRRLARFGIRLADLVQSAPRHIDTRAMCVRLAKKIAATPAIAAKLEHTGQLPIVSILDAVAVGRKAVENNRKYIIAIYVALTSRMEIIKSYINFIEEGALDR